MDSSLAHLAQAQSVTPLRDAAVLAGGLSADTDVDAFLEEIYCARK